jgi:hypothetical protein
MSIQVLPTAPSPTVTHLMNREALDAIAAHPSPILPRGRSGRGVRGGDDREGRDRLCSWRLVRDFSAKRVKRATSFLPHCLEKRPAFSRSSFLSRCLVYANNLLVHETDPRIRSNLNFGAYTVLIFAAGNHGCLATRSFFL